MASNEGRFSCRIITDKNSLFGGPSIGKMELCVKGEKAATCGALGLLYRSNEQF